MKKLIKMVVEFFTITKEEACADGIVLSQYRYNPKQQWIDCGLPPPAELN
jgi:hypothetical protein